MGIFEDYRAILQAMTLGLVQFVGAQQIRLEIFRFVRPPIWNLVGLSIN